MGADTTGPSAHLPVADGKRRRRRKRGHVVSQHPRDTVAPGHHAGAGSLDPPQAADGFTDDGKSPQSLRRRHLVGYRLSLAGHQWAAAQSGGDPETGVRSKQPRMGELRHGAGIRRGLAGLSLLSAVSRISHSSPCQHPPAASWDAEDASVAPNPSKAPLCPWD